MLYAACFAVELGLRIFAQAPPGGVGGVARVFVAMLRFRGCSRPRVGEEVPFGSGRHGDDSPEQESGASCVNLLEQKNP